MFHIFLNKEIENKEIKNSPLRAILLYKEANKTGQYNTEYSNLSTSELYFLYYITKYKNADLARKINIHEKRISEKKTQINSLIYAEPFHSDQSCESC